MRRNIFDHYSQLENHVTNSLLSVLEHNPSLTAKILKELGVPIKPQRLRVLSQRLPIKLKDRESVIDGSIFGEDFKFCVGIENKIVSGTVKSDQINAHIRQLAPYSKAVLWIISPDDSIDLAKYKTPNNINIKHSSWKHLTSALRRFRQTTSKGYGLKLYQEFLTFLERMPEMTGFHGLRFDYGYDEELAKNYVKRITPALTPSMNKIYKKCKNTRSMISGAWDCWYSTSKAESGVHPGYSIKPEYLRCTIVLANKCTKEWRTLYDNIENNPQGFLRLIAAVEREKPKHSEAVVSFRQRHYKSRSGEPIHDAEVQIQCNTLLGQERAKKNLIWLDLIKQVAESKRKYNYQLEIGYNIYFADNVEMESAKAIYVMEKCFKNLKPVYDYLTSNSVP